MGEQGQEGKGGGTVGTGRRSKENIRGGEAGDDREEDEEQGWHSNRRRYWQWRGQDRVQADDIAHPKHGPA